MEQNIEVELKFQVLNETKVRQFLEVLEFKKESRVIDTYLDTLDGNLFQKGVFVRIRDGNLLDFKFNKEDFLNNSDGIVLNHTHCDEHSFPLPLQENMLKDLNETLVLLKMKSISLANLEDLKKQNNLIESMVIDKVRRKYVDGHFDIVLDDVKDLGIFLEIEYLAKRTDNLSNIKEEMRARLIGLDLKPIPTGYNELYWKKHNFDLYLKGKYLLEEDKQFKTQ